MTDDSDTPFNLDERRFTRESATFKHVFLTVQGTDEAACDEALKVQLATFATDPDEWISGQRNYSRKEVTTDDGETKIAVWELDATLAAQTGFTPWSGLEWTR